MNLNPKSISVSYQTCHNEQSDLYMNSTNSSSNDFDAGMVWDVKIFFLQSFRADPHFLFFVSFYPTTLNLCTHTDASWLDHNVLHNTF